MNLEQELRALELEWPETPALTPELAPRRRSRRTLVLAFALLLLALAVAFAVPPARSAILRFLHLRGETIEFVGTLPQAQQRALEAGLGPERTLVDAERIAGFQAVLPPRSRITHAYALRGALAIPLGRGLLLTELSGSDLGMSKKLVSGATRLEPVMVDGDNGIWIEGGQHVFTFIGPGGVPEARTMRLAGNVLVWEHDSLTLRIEGPVTKDEALVIARSIP